MMGPRCLISEEEVAAVIKGLKIMGKVAGPIGVVSEMSFDVKVGLQGSVLSPLLFADVMDVFFQRDEKWSSFRFDTIVHHPRNDDYAVYSAMDFSFGGCGFDPHCEIYTERGSEDYH